MTVAIQRPLRGSRISTFYPVKSLPSLSSLDSAFQLQEYISLLIRLDVHDVDAIVSLPGTSSREKDDKNKEGHAENTKDGDKDSEKNKSEITVDESCWIYEQLRRLAQDLSHPLITTLQQECTRASCPEMKAGEWLYLCVAHGNDGAMEQCCAIDYILHTVDSATALLNSPRTFPSRLSIPQTSHRHFSSLARRLGRIFAHAYFHHREAFEQAEAESSLYARFLALTAKFDLVPAEFLVIPSNHYTDDSRDSAASPPRDRNDNRRQFQQQTEDPTRASQKHVEELSLGEENWKIVNPPGLAESTGTPPPNGGIGESPIGNLRSRFGRNRTDTMVFADAEATALADELALRARQGELEPDYEIEGPKTARPGVPDNKTQVEEEEEADLDNDTQFEISLSPEEEIPGTLDISVIPTRVEEESGYPSLVDTVIPEINPIPVPQEEETLTKVTSSESIPPTEDVEQSKDEQSVSTTKAAEVLVFETFTPEAIALAVASLSAPSNPSFASAFNVPEERENVQPSTATEAPQTKELPAESIESVPVDPSEQSTSALLEEEPLLVSIEEEASPEGDPIPVKSTETEPADSVTVSSTVKLDQPTSSNGLDEAKEDADEANEEVAAVPNS